MASSVGRYVGEPRAIGLTLSQTEVEAVTLRSLPGKRWRVDELRRATLPDNTIGLQGQIEDREALAEALATVFPRPARFGSPVNVSFDGPQVLVRGSSIKDVPWSMQRDYLITQIRRYPNFKQGDLAVGYHLIEKLVEEGKPGERIESEVLVAATRQEVLQTLEEVLRQIGLNMGLGTSRALAAFGVPLRLDEALAERNELWMGVTMVPAKLVISLWQGYHFIFYREIPLVKDERMPANGELSRPSMSGEALQSVVRGSGPLDELVTELIVEIRRSFGFYHVEDPAAVPVYLIDFPKAGLLCEQIQIQDPALQVHPYRLQALPALELGAEIPSVAAIGTAMMDSGSSSVIDLSFIKRRPAMWYLFAGVPRPFMVGTVGVGLILVVTLFLDLGFLGPRMRALQSEDNYVQQQSQLIHQKSDALNKQLPGEEARRWVKNNLEGNTGSFAALGQLLDKDLPAAIPASAWLDSLTLEEQSKINIIGRSSDPQAAVELTRQLKRLPYLAIVRLLVIDRVPGTKIFRFRITGLVAPSRASHG